MTLLEPSHYKPRPLLGRLRWMGSCDGGRRCGPGPSGAGRKTPRSHALPAAIQNDGGFLEGLYGCCSHAGIEEAEDRCLAPARAVGVHRDAGQQGATAGGASLGDALVTPAQGHAWLHEALDVMTICFEIANWVLLGFLSSFGMGASAVPWPVVLTIAGFGLHTFVLFLAPAIVSYIRDSGMEQTFWQNYTHVWWWSLSWGLGTAIGELPPYFSARKGA